MKIKSTLIIAEAGVNHNGSISMAKELIDIASTAGADFVKFQTFKAKRLVTRKAEKANYQKNLTKENETQYEMLKKLELTVSNHKKLIEYCKKKNIGFLSTGFDLESIQLLVNLDIQLFKIPSGEITNLPLLRRIGGIGKPIILSTGMSKLSEVKDAIEILIKAGSSLENITLLHCNTEYPTPLNDVNLNAMLSLSNEFDVKVGYSDHTLGIEIPIAAVAMGASVIEKHFTLDRKLPGPDHLASLEPNELKKMIVLIRNIEKALGDGIKKPSKSESKNISLARRSIVAKKKIRKGELLTEENLTLKRPGNGISPMKWDEIINKRARYNFNMDDLIKL